MWPVAADLHQGKDRHICPAFPVASSCISAGLENPDLEKDKALLKESGYDGRTVIFMQPSDLAANFNATVVVAEGMRKAGFKVEIEPLDWGTLSQRRNDKGPVDHRRGGRRYRSAGSSTLVAAGEPMGGCPHRFVARAANLSVRSRLPLSRPPLSW